MFESKDQYRAWQHLYKAIDEAPEQVPCISYPDAYFPKKGDSGPSGELKWAKKMCQSCPVVNECLAYAVKYEDEGIWAGKSPVERKAIRRKFQ
jgi:WhiB family transcriptional regulator, redox-sensing transcriptional regulator